MSRWVGFIDLLALRHAASIDQAAVERLLSSFFEVLRSFAKKFSSEDLTVDILSDSAVLRFSSLDQMRRFYLQIRPEMILKETYYRLGIAAGDVQIERYNLNDDENIAGTYFRGDAGMAAYAAQNSLNGAGAIFVEPRSSARAAEPIRKAAADFASAIEEGTIVGSFYFGRASKPDVEPYLDFAMTKSEIGDMINLRSEDRLADIVKVAQRENDGFTFFDEVYSKYAYTRGLDRFVARKYLSIFFTLLSSIDFSNVKITEDGSEFSNLPPALCRMFFDGRFRGMERDEDFSLVLLRALSHILAARTREHSGAYRISELLDEVPELRWVCRTLARRKPLYRRLGGTNEKLVPMKVKDMILRGMTDLGYLYW